MTQYNVTGMSCAACQARVEKAVSKVEGVTACAVSLLTNSMGVEGSADPAAIIKAVEDAGYGAAVKGAAGGQSSAGSSGSAGEQGDSGGGRYESASYVASVAEQTEALINKETPRLAKRLAASVGFLLVLMYFSMGHMMFGWPVPPFFEHNHVALGLIQMVLSGVVLVINQRFFINGYKSLIHLAPNMDSLIALGSSVAYGYSLVILFMMTGADSATAMKYMDELYFESAAMILTLITVGKMLEAYSKGKTTNALKSLLSLAPKTANIIRDGKEVTVSIDEVAKEDIYVVRPGEHIPVDGVITEGASAVNEAALTGESMPRDVAAGDEVSSGTLNLSGFITCRANRVGEDTTLSQIIQMVSDAAATKAPVAKLADRISGVFVPAVIAIALVTIAVWIFVGADAGYALARGITVLVVSCPCALGLATPVAIMVGNGVGARNGILFKTAEALQETGRIDIVALDKTGTVTKGDPEVTDAVPAEGISMESLLKTAYSLEIKSEHPLAKAVVKYVNSQGLEDDGTGAAKCDGCERDGVMAGKSEDSERDDMMAAKSDGPEHGGIMAAARESFEIFDFSISPGNGLSGRLEDGSYVYGGNARFMESVGLKVEDDLSVQGKTVMYFAKGAAGTDAAGDIALLGMIAVADTIREDSAEAIAEFKKLGIKTVMITGDNELTAKAIAAQAGVDEVIAGVLPDGKDEAVRRLKEGGRVAMIGDGINDAPALTRADIGIAIGAGTDVAIDAADVVLMKSSLMDAVAAVRLSRKTYTNIKENLFWALIYNVLLIPTAAGVYAKFGIMMNPMLGAAAMSLSSFCVVSNALRLNFFKMKKGSANSNVDKEKTVIKETLKNESEKNEAVTVSHKEEKRMQKTMTIEGMMCEHCEARVKKALESVEGVVSADVSHEKGTAVVELSSDVADDVLSAAVTAQDYEVKGVA